VFDENCRLIAEPAGTDASGAITMLANADGYVEVPQDEQFIDVAEEVLVTLLRGAAVKP
jgi:molybdopterin biosynthesis enzyme